MEVRSQAGGWDAQVFAASTGPPEEITGWGRQVGEVGDADTRQSIDLEVPRPSQYFLLWFTKAAPAADEEGRYQVSISDIKLIS
jgi:hypothetical protein